MANMVASQRSDARLNCHQLRLFLDLVLFFILANSFAEADDVNEYRSAGAIDASKNRGAGTLCVHRVVVPRFRRRVPDHHDIEE